MQWNLNVVIAWEVVITDVIVTITNICKSTVWNAKTNITDRGYFISENFSRATDYNRRKLYAVFNKAKHMDQFMGKISLMGDVLIIDCVKYTVDTLNKLPNELNPRQFSEKTVGGNY